MNRSGPSGRAGMRRRGTPPKFTVRSARGSKSARRRKHGCCTAAVSTSRTPWNCSPNRSSTACWSAARRSIPRCGSSLCAPPSLRYLARRMYGILIGILLLDALILATAVLLQAGQGGGLASMGGGAGTETIMGGRQATTLLTKVTWWTAGIFLFLALILTFMPQSANQVRSVLEGQGQAPTPVAPSQLPIETQPTAPPAPPPARPPSNRRP